MEVVQLAAVGTLDLKTTGRQAFLLGSTAGGLLEEHWVSLRTVEVYYTGYC